MTKTRVSHCRPFFCDLVPRLCFTWFQKPGNNNRRMYLTGLARGQLLLGPATGTFPMLGNNLPSKPPSQPTHSWASRTWSCSWFAEWASSLRMIEIRQTLNANIPVALSVSEIHFPELCFHPSLSVTHLHITRLHGSAACSLATLRQLQRLLLLE